MTSPTLLVLRNSLIVAGLTFFSILSAKGGVITPQDLMATLISAGLTFFIELAHAYKLDPPDGRTGSLKLLLF